MRKIYYNRTWAKDRGKVKASQVSRTKPGPEKGHRWCRLREIPRRGRGPSRHGLGLSNVRSPPHNQAHFPSGKDGVFFHSLSSPRWPIPMSLKGREIKKRCSRKAAKRKQRKPRSDAGDQASWEDLEDIWKNIHGREKQGSVERLSAHLISWFCPLPPI